MVNAHTIEIIWASTIYVVQSTWFSSEQLARFASPRSALFAHSSLIFRVQYSDFLP